VFLLSLVLQLQSLLVGHKAAVGAGIFRSFEIPAVYCPACRVVLQSRKHRVSVYIEKLLTRCTTCMPTLRLQ
jgi:hypothetical protein